MTTNTGNAVYADRFRAPADRGNPIRNVDPIIMFILMTAVAVLPIAFPGFVVAAVVCALLPLVAVAAGVAREFLPTYWKLMLAVGFVLFLLRAAFAGTGTPLFRFGSIAPTWDGILDGARVALLVMAMSGAVTLFFSVVTVRYLMLALELRGVTPRATYVILASFQSITDLGRNARTVLQAQQSRGIETHGNVLVRARAFFPILAPVFLAALNETEQRAIALDARAFNAQGKHSHLVTLRPVRASEKVAVALAIAAVTLAFVGAGLGWY